MVALTLSVSRIKFVAHVLGRLRGVCVDEVTGERGNGEFAASLVNSFRPWRDKGQGGDRVEGRNYGALGQLSQRS